MKEFTLARLPQFYYGSGMIRLLPDLIAPYGRRVVLITGRRSFTDTFFYDLLLTGLKQSGCTTDHYTVQGEPTVALIDFIAQKAAARVPEVVLSIGGGSVLDAGKAVAAMIPVGGTVARFLEDVGTSEHPGNTLPFIAVPTTSGTGSEATRNAVITGNGPVRYKKSLRHDRFIPAIAILDPALMIRCPEQVTAAAGLDAFTQLLEGFISVKSSPLTDMMALEGIKAIAGAMVPVCTTEAGNVDYRGKMAYGAYLSGVVLANAGLGVIHGLAGPAGGFTPVPHGVFCAALLPMAVDKIFSALTCCPEQNRNTVAKLDQIAAIISPGADACRLSELLNSWKQRFGLPSLRNYMHKDDLGVIASAGSNKNSPVKFTQAEMLELLEIAY